MEMTVKEINTVGVAVYAKAVIDSLRGVVPAGTNVNFEIPIGHAGTFGDIICLSPDVDGNSKNMVSFAIPMPAEDKAGDGVA